MATTRYEREALAWKAMKEFMALCEQARDLFLAANMPLPPMLVRVFGKQEYPPDWSI